MTHDTYDHTCCKLIQLHKLSNPLSQPSSISEISFSDKCEFAFCSILESNWRGLQEQKGLDLWPCRSHASMIGTFMYFQDCVVFGRSGLYGSNPMKPVQISLGPPNAVHHPKWSAFPVPSCAIRLPSWCESKGAAVLSWLARDQVMHLSLLQVDTNSRNVPGRGLHLTTVR